MSEIISDAKGVKNCPFCAEEILAVAVKCKHCGSDLNQEAPSDPNQGESEPKSVEPKNLNKISWPGAIVGIIGAIYLINVIYFNDADSDQTSSSIQTELEGQALAKMDSFGLDFFCSKVIDRDLKNVTIGTATGGSTTRFPAIKANYSGTCIKALGGDRDKKMVSEFWIFFALDSEAGKMRCYSIDNRKERIDKHAAECEFKTS